MAVLVIRDFERTDQEQVRRLILDGLREHWGELDESLNQDLHDIAGTYAGGRTVVAEVDDEVVGTGTVILRDEETAELVRMSVHPERRRSGIGRSLVEELVATARSWSACRVVLETSSVWREVITFYRACGFTVTGTSEGEFGEDTWFEYPLSP